MAPSVSLLTILLLASLASWSHAHPQCLNSLPPFEKENRYICKEYNSRSPGNTSTSCCSREEELEVREELRQVVRLYYPKPRLRLRRQCKAYLRQVLCTRCSPWAQHIHEGTPRGLEDAPRPSLCHDFCTEFYTNCYNLIFDYFKANSTGYANTKADASRFCDSHKARYPFYCYPNIVDGPTFPDTIQPVKLGNCLCGTELTSSLTRPVAAVPPGDGSGRLFAVEQEGRIRVLTKDNKLLKEPFLDIKSKVYVSRRRGDERGLLGMAFDPKYSSNGRFYVYHSSRSTRSVNHVSRISEYRVNSTDPNRADPTSERVIMTIPQPEANHNGGQLFFGFDGYLYIPLGDGGGAGDRHGRIGHGLDLTTLLGSMLRIDVSNPNVAYSIPEDNPFADANSTARPEIYAYGLRNPWRCSVDRGDKDGVGKGRIFCGDVGQNEFEEIDIIEKGGNYGWRAFEGFSCFDRRLCRDNRTNFIMPIHAYSHRVGRSVTGGYVYRGCLFPNLQGKYIYADFTAGKLFALTMNETSGEWVNEQLCLGGNLQCHSGLVGSRLGFITSLAEDEDGELYVVSIRGSSSDPFAGSLIQIVDPSSFYLNMSWSTQRSTWSESRKVNTSLLESDIGSVYSAHWVGGKPFFVAFKDGDFTSMWKLSSQIRRNENCKLTRDLPTPK